MYKRKMNAAVGSSLVALTLVLSGCGGGSGDSGDTVIPDTTGTDQGSTSVPNNTGDQNTTDQPDSNVSLVATENQIDVSSASLVSSASKMEGGITLRSAADFNFPEVIDNNGSLSMTIPNGPAPSFPARRDISSGGGQTIQFGDPVSLKYDMFSWSTGELVESSSEFEEAHIVKAGVSKSFPVPEALTQALLGRSLGDTLQIVFPVGTEDLPDYLDNTDAYILLVELM